MTHLIAVAGFFGGWLLVAGPLLQAYLELRNEELDREGMDAVQKSVPKPDPISPWWWLLPPVAWLRQRARARQHQANVMKALDPRLAEQAVSFFNKANAWFVVAGGAALIAVKETWELVETWGWPVWIFWVLIVICPILCLGNLVGRAIQSEQALGHEKPPPRKRPARSTP